MFRARRAAVAVALPVAAALAVGSYVVSRGDDSAQLADARGRLAQAVVSGLPSGVPVVADGAGQDGAEDAQADLAAVQHVAFSSPAKPGGAATALVKRSPTQIRSAAVAATLKGRSVHIEGVVVEKKGPVDVDLRIAAGVAEGTLASSRGTVTLRRLGRNIFFQPDEKFVASLKLQDQEAAGALGGMWFKVGPKDRGYTDIARLTYLKTWAAVVGSSRAAGRKAGPTLGGVPTVIVYGGRGPQAESLYVATAGPSYPLYLSTRDKKSHLAFNHWGQDVSVDEPSADSVIIAHIK